MIGRRPRWLLVPALVLLVAGLVPQATIANHRWENYHWARTDNPLRIQFIDSMTPAWDSRLVAVNNDWNQSNFLQNQIVDGSSTASVRASCPYVRGKIRSCNGNYGATGWLGLAEISVRGNHIIQGRAKQNQYYFAMSQYDTEAARRHVLCQEIGHLFGIGHNRNGVSCSNDEDGINDPAYQSPNAHDYDLLRAIYTHKDGSTSIASKSIDAASEVAVAPDPTGRRNGGSSMFVRDAGNGITVVTHVLWADTAAIEAGQAVDDDAPDPAPEEPRSDPAPSTRGRAPDDSVATEPPLAEAPTAPNALTVEMRGKTVMVSWSDNAGDETGYRVYRSTDGETWEMAAELRAGTTRYIDRDVASGKTYVYQVSAFNETGERWSDEATITTD